MSVLYAVYHGEKLVSVLPSPPSDKSYTVVAYEIKSQEELNYVLKPILDALGIVKPVSIAQVVWSREGKPVSVSGCEIKKWSEPVEISFPVLDTEKVKREYLKLPKKVERFSLPLIEVSAVYEDGSLKEYYIPAHVHGYGKLNGEKLASILDMKDKKVKRIIARLDGCTVEYSRPDPEVFLDFDGKCFTYFFVRRSPYPAVFSGTIEVISLVNGKLVKTENCPPQDFELAVARFKPSFLTDSEYLAVLAVPNPPMVKTWSYTNEKVVLDLTCSCDVRATVATLEYEDVAQLESGFYTVKPVLKDIKEVEAYAENGKLEINIQPPARLFLTTSNGIPVIPQKYLPSLAMAVRKKVGDVARKVFGDDNDTSVLAIALFAPVLQRVLGVDVPADLMNEVLKYAPIVIDSGPPKVTVKGSPSLVEFDTGGKWAILEFFVADDLNKKYANIRLRLKGKGYFRAKDFLVASSSSSKDAWKLLNPVGNFALPENETDKHPEYVGAFTGIEDLSPTRTLVRCGNCVIDSEADEWEPWLVQQIAGDYILNDTDLGKVRAFVGEKSVQGILSVIFLDVLPGLRKVRNISEDDYTAGKKEIGRKHLAFFANGQTSCVIEKDGDLQIPALYKDYLVAVRDKGLTAFLTPKSVRYSLTGMSPFGVRIPIEVEKEETGYVPPLPSIRLLSFNGIYIEIEVLASQTLIKRRPKVLWVLEAVYPYQSYEGYFSVGALEGTKLRLRLPNWFKYGNVCLEFRDGFLRYKAC